MTVSRQDVLYALLALDAYNRHSDPLNVKMSEDGTQLSTQIGTASWQRSSDQLENRGESTLSGSQLAGFSASYYEIGSEKLISYRGTDFDFSSWAGVAEFLKDFGTGWLTSFSALNPEGFDPLDTGEPLQHYQPYHTQQFYEIVTGGKVFPTSAEAAASEASTQNVTLVGHSLDGALAGMIGTLTDDNTKIFNEIPTAGMAINTAANDNQVMHALWRRTA